MFVAVHKGKIELDCCKKKKEMSEKTPVKYNYPSSSTGGVRPISIKGLFEDQIARVSEEFTDADRKWRKQWLHDQILSLSEPRHVPELELKNPIRRAASAPWKFIEAKMTPLFGASFVQTFRYCVPKTLVAIFAVYASYYHLKYNQNDWTRAYGWSVHFSRPTVYPGDPNFPFKSDKACPQDYDDRGFYSRKVFLD